MSYTPGSLYDVQKKIQETLNSVLASTKCKKVSDIKETALVKPQIQKNVVAGPSDRKLGI